MDTYWLTFQLDSDATFGRGEGIAGLIDREVEHDRFGLPYLRGRTLKGLVSEEADNILFALEQSGAADVKRWREARNALFGRAGSTHDDRARLRFGNAQLPAAVRQAVVAGHQAAVSQATSSGDGDEKTGPAESNRQRLQALESLTAVRRQTAIESSGKSEGVPVEGSLRAMRIILRQTPFEALLLSEGDLFEDELGLLAAAVLAFRRAGTGRNRGRGKLQADLCDKNGASILLDSYRHFLSAACPTEASL